MATFGSLFSGVGGLDLGLERAGWTVRWQVEIDPFCRAVLAKHWPAVPRFEDVRTLTGDELERVDLVAGGFPCQPVSSAGKRRAQADTRWLWPEFARLLGVVRPRFVLVENVPGLYDRGLGDVLGSLAQGGFDAEWDCIPAASVGAPHLRWRVFVVGWRRAGARADVPNAERPGATVADAHGQRCPQGAKLYGAPAFGGPASHRDNADGRGDALAERPALFDAASGRALARWRDELTTPSDAGWPMGQWATEPGLGRVADGISHRTHRLRGLGGAVVPQVAEFIGRRLLATLPADPPGGRAGVRG